MVAMLNGDTLPGVEVLAHDQPLASSEDIEIYTTHLYAAGRYLGFLGTARNLTDSPFVLRLPEYQAPGLKAIAADLEHPGGRRDAGVPGRRAGVAVLGGGMRRVLPVQYGGVRALQEHPVCGLLCASCWSP